MNPTGTTSAPSANASANTSTTSVNTSTKDDTDTIDPPESYDNSDRSFRKALQSASNPQLLLSNKKKNTRRKHRNSHLGCGTCKKRRIKCDENLPSCLNCLKGKLHCAYLNLDPTARNALRMAQYNQNLRNDKYSDEDKEEAGGRDSNSPPSRGDTSLRSDPGRTEDGAALHPLLAVPPVAVPTQVAPGSQYNLMVPNVNQASSNSNSLNSSPSNHSTSSEKLPAYSPNPTNSTTNISAMTPGSHTSTMGSPPNVAAGPNGSGPTSAENANAVIVPSPYGPLVQFQTFPVNNVVYPNMGMPVQVQSMPQVVQVPLPLLQNQLQLQGLQTLPQSIQQLNLHGNPVPIALNQQQVVAAQTQAHSQQIQAQQVQAQQVQAQQPLPQQYDAQAQYNAQIQAHVQAQAQAQAQAQVQAQALAQVQQPPPLLHGFSAPQVHLQPPSSTSSTSSNSVTNRTTTLNPPMRPSDSAENSANTTPPQIPLPTISSSLTGKNIKSSDPSNHVATTNSSSKTSNISANNSPPTLPSIHKDPIISSQISGRGSISSPPYAYGSSNNPPSANTTSNSNGNSNLESPRSSNSGFSSGNASNPGSRSGSTTNLNLIKNIKLKSESPPDTKLGVKPVIKVEDEKLDKVPSISKLLS